jgi:hypothetical protein
MAVKARWLILLLTFVATPLLANQPPGPQELLAVISLISLMMLLTLLSGGYAILKRLTPRSLTVLKILGVFVLVFLGTSAEGILMALGFVIFALFRAVHMIAWGVIARGTPRPEHLRDAQPRRLILAGVVLIFVTVFLAFTFFAFLGTTSVGDKYRIESMRDYVALRLALRTPPSPQRAELEKDAASRLMSLEGRMKRREAAGRNDPGVRIDEAGNHFVVYMMPGVMRTPLPPYNLFVDLPTYRADETGVIRMKLVHSRDELCPPDAPVIDRVGNEDIRAVLAGKAK